MSLKGFHVNRFMDWNASNAIVKVGQGADDPGSSSSETFFGVNGF